jgi:hypothetical protein
MTTAYQSRHSSRDDEPHNDKTTKPVEKKPKTLPKAPSGGTVVAAVPGYSVVTAAHNEAGVLTFGAPLTVIAWSVGGDGAAYPHTALPIDEKALAVGTVQPDGRVLGADGTIYPGGTEWQAALNAEDAAVKAEKAAADEAAAKEKAEADAKAEGKHKAA